MSRVDSSVLLLSPPGGVARYSFVPLGLAILSPAAPAGYRTVVRDAERLRWSDLDAAYFEPFDIIGVSLRFTYQEKPVKRLIGALKSRFPKKRVVIGGSHAAEDPTGLMLAGADAVVHNEGEWAWNELLTAWKEGDDERPILGTATRVNGEIVVHPVQPFHPPDESPMPEFELFEPRNYRFMAGYCSVTAEASRGCPYHCSFCARPAVWNGRWVSKSPERVAEEFDRIERAGFDFAFFADDNFGINPKALRPILEVLSRRKKPIHLMATMQARTIANNPGLLDELWRAGMRYMTLDINAVNDRERELYNRVDSVETMRRALTMVRESPIAAVSNILIGAPGESEPDMTSAIRFTKRYADVCSIGVLEPRPGNAFWRDEHWEITEKLSQGIPMLHEKPGVVMRVFWREMFSYYANPLRILAMIFHRKSGVRDLLRANYMIYGQAAFFRFFMRRGAQQDVPVLG